MVREVCTTLALFHEVVHNFHSVDPNHIELLEEYLYDMSETGNILTAWVLGSVLYAFLVAMNAVWKPF